MREETTSALHSLSNSSSSGDDILLALKKMHSGCKKYKTANCYEYATSGLYLLQRFSTNTDNIHAAIFGVKGGDHVSFALGLKADSTPDFNTWGDEAVVCESWAGSPPFLAKKIPEKLGYHEFYIKGNSVSNITGPLNLKSHHKLQTAYPSLAFMDACYTTRIRVKDILQTLRYKFAIIFVSAQSPLCKRVTTEKH